MYNRMTGLSARRLLMVALVAAVTVGCGEDEEDRDIACECADAEICIDDECVDEPVEGQACPSGAEGEIYGGLECVDGVWIDPDSPAESVGIEVAVQPPGEVMAGESFDVAFQLVDGDGDAVEEGGVEVGATLNRGEFAGGHGELSESTGEGGLAEFSVAVDDVDTGYVLTGSLTDDSDASAETDSFDVVAPSAGLTFATQPPAEVDAGEHFVVDVAVVGDDGEGLDREGVEIELTVSDVSFGAGVDELVEETDESGEANFEVSIEVAATDLVLSAAADDEDLGDSTDSQSFDVVAGQPDEETSWIRGEDGVADGQTVSEVTIELFDEFGNAVVGVIPEFRASGDDDDNGYQDCSETDDDGIASCGMTTTQPGEQTLEIVEPVEVVGEEIYFAFDCDEEATPFGGGEGTTDNPYAICAPEHLENIYEDEDNDYLDGSFMLVEDIDMAGVEFEPIGLQDGLWSEGFAGEFDGQKYAIENLTIEGSEDTVGLFTIIEEGATVYDLSLIDVKVHGGSSHIGAFAGFNYGKIDRCRAVDVDIANDGFGVGGFAGAIGEGGQISESYVTGVVGDTDNRAVGGLVGQGIDGEVVDSYTTAEVIGDEAVGGILGQSTAGDIELQRTYSTGAVTGNEDWGGATGDVSGAATVVEQTYWDVDTSAVDGDERAEPLETDEFGDADADHFEQWDFDDVWEIGEAPDGHQRPILQWQDD